MNIDMTPITAPGQIRITDEQMIDDTEPFEEDDNYEEEEEE